MATEAEKLDALEREIKDLSQLQGEIAALLPAITEMLADLKNMQAHQQTQILELKALAADTKRRADRMEQAWYNIARRNGWTEEDDWPPLNGNQPN